MRVVLILFSCLAHLTSAALISSAFNPCALDQEIMQKLIDCGVPKSPKRSLIVWEKRTQIIPGMQATDLILEVCRINNNAGYTLWSQYMSELEPEDAEVVDRVTYECLKLYNLAV